MLTGGGVEIGGSGLVLVAGLDETIVAAASNHAGDHTVGIVSEELVNVAGDEGTVVADTVALDAGDGGVVVGVISTAVGVQAVVGGLLDGSHVVVGSLDGVAGGYLVGGLETIARALLISSTIVGGNVARSSTGAGKRGLGARTRSTAVESRLAVVGGCASLSGRLRITVGAYGI